METRSIHLGDTQHEAVGTLADVPGFDKTGERHGISGPRKYPVTDQCGPPRRRCKTGSNTGNHHGQRKYPPSPKQKRRRAKSYRGCDGNRQDRFAFGREIERNAGAIGDRHPGQQSAGTSLGLNPLAQLFGSTRCRSWPAQSLPPPRRAAARFLQFPAPGPEPCSALPSATQRYTPRSQRYLKLYRRRKPERMQNSGKNDFNCCGSLTELTSGHTLARRIRYTFHSARKHHSAQIPIGQLAASLKPGIARDRSRTETTPSGSRRRDRSAAVSCRHGKAVRP